MLASVRTVVIRTNHFVRIASFHLCLPQGTQGSVIHLGVKQYFDHTILSGANEKRNWQIFADFGGYLIGLVRPLYADFPVSNVDIDHEVFALDSTTISLSINLFTWAHVKYSRGSVKAHTLLNLRGNIPESIHITDDKYHDSNVLDIIVSQVVVIE